MVQTTFTYSRSLPVRAEVDVLVAGGGPAGVAAALTARRQGCSVYLVEAHSCLGGMGTAGLVPCFMPFTDGVNFLAGGTGWEVLQALRQAGGAWEQPDNPVVGIRAETLKRVYDDLLVNAGVAFSFHTQVVDVTVEQGWVKEVVCAGKSGLFVIRAKTYVDGTGDGDLAVYAGARYEMGDEDGKTMPGTLCSLWAGVDWEAVHASGLGSGESRIEQAIEDGLFTNADRHLPGMFQVSPTLGGGNIGHTFDVDGTDEISLTQAYLWGRKSLAEYERYYKEYLKGFEHMELVTTGSLMGIRETRRITGDYVLTLDDFQRRAVFEDEIGRFSYPVDIHVARPDKESFEKFHQEFTRLRLGNGESYGIPYRILTPVELKNVLTAGRCVSTDRSLEASIRVMPASYITGQAAGMAAAIQLQEKTDVHHVPVKLLQDRLKAMGAFLPNW